MDDDLKHYLDSIQKAIREESAAAHAETRRHFDVSTEAMKGEFQLLAETVAHLNQRIDATNANVDRTAAETQALIRFSHAELDRRVRILETKH